MGVPVLPERARFTRLPDSLRGLPEGCVVTARVHIKTQEPHDEDLVCGDPPRVTIEVTFNHDPWSINAASEALRAAYGRALDDIAKVKGTP